MLSRSAIWLVSNRFILSFAFCHVNEDEYIDAGYFSKVRMRVGIIREASRFNEARKPSYKLLIDFGPYGMKRSSAQITELYETSELIGKRVIAVTNLKPKQIANFISEVLVLGVLDGENRVVLLTTERDAPAGSLVH